MARDVALEQDHLGSHCLSQCHLTSCVNLRVSSTSLSLSSLTCKHSQHLLLPRLP